MAGTTGYDALREIGGLFIDPAGAGPLTDLVDSTGSHYGDMPQLARTLKVRAVTDTLGSELRRLCRAIVGRDRIDPSGAARRRRRPAQPHRRVPLGLSELVVGVAHRAGRNRRRATGIGRAARDRLRGGGDGGEAAVRLQQLCGAATAKSMEDCLFYRDARLVSLNEVGGEPDRFGVEPRRVPPAARRCGRDCGRRP